MAGDSDITAIKPSRNAVTVFTTGAIVAHDTGDAYLDVSTMDASKVIFIVEQSGTDTNTTLTISAGYYAAEGIGDLTKKTSASGEYIVGPLETARFKDSDGYIRLSKATDDTSALYVRAILLP